MPKVSIVLTSYNHAKYLRASIDSILAQTFRDFELFIWDDASSDNSWEIISSYADPRIKAFRNASQKRGTLGINTTARKLASGEYFAVHCSDDLWMPDKLAKQVACLDKRPEIAAVFTLVQIIDEEGNDFTRENHPYYRVFDQPNRSRHAWLRHFLEKGNALCHPSVCMRLSRLQECNGYRYGIAQLGDFDVWIRLCLRHQIHIIQEKLTVFRVRDEENNTSGVRRDTRIAMDFNLFLLLDNYASMKSRVELFKIFPELRRIYDKETIPVQYMLAMLFFEKDYYGIGKLFGLRMLFDLFQDEDTSELLRNECNFTINDFIYLQRNTDVFSREKVRELNEENKNLYSQLIKSNQIIQKMDKKIYELVAESVKKQSEAL